MKRIIKNSQMNQKCYLFVPAKSKYLEKIDSFKDCAVIIDIEDSIPDNQKDMARKMVVDYLEDHSSQDKNCFVRLNANELPLELPLFDKYNVGFMLPKMSEVCSYHNYEDILLRHEVMALIESPMAIVNLKEICSCSWVDCVAFGAEDFTASTGIINENEYLRNVKSQIVTFAKAFQKYAIDSPSFNVDDDSKFEIDVEETVKLGFDGKLSIHPKHVRQINEAYNTCDVETLQSIVSRFEKEGGGVVCVNGRIYEKMHIDQIKKKLKNKSYES